MKKNPPFDIVLFISSLILFILWLLRALFINNLYHENEVSKIGETLFIPMVIGVFMIPFLVVFRTTRKQVSIKSILFFALLLNSLTLTIIILMK